MFLSIKVDQYFFQEMKAERAFSENGEEKKRLFNLFLKTLVLFGFVLFNFVLIKEDK